MRRKLSISCFFVVALLFVLPWPSLAVAKKPDNSGGGDRSAYKIISLPSPDGDPSHYGVLKAISDVGFAGEVYVVGYHRDSSDEDRSYCWTVDADGNCVR